MKIYVIRHGETDANKNGILQGSSDWPLNEFGIQLAEITGEKMKGIKFDACISSPLSRAKQTAEIILNNSGNSNIEIQYDDRIKELDMGIYEGKKFRRNEVEVPILKMLIFKWNAFFCGKFKGGESAFDCCKRTSSFLDDLSKKDYDTVLVTSHGAAITAMLNRFNKNRLSFWQSGVPLNCSVNIIEVENGKMKLLERNKIYYDKKYAIDRFKA